MKFFKKLSLLLSVTVISILCLAVSASATWEKVSEDSNIEYHFDDVTGTLHIRGEGKIPDDFLGKCGKYYYGEDYEEFDGADDDDFVVEDFSYMQKVKTLIIEEGITEIGHCAFLGNYRYYKFMTELRTVILPDSLETIGNYAFGNMSSLKTVTFEATDGKIPDIDYNAFCTSGPIEFNLPWTKEQHKKFVGTYDVLDREYAKDVFFGAKIGSKLIFADGQELIKDQEVIENV